MLWTAGSAVILAMYRGMYAWSESEMPDAMRAVFNVHRILCSIIYGAAYASVAVFLHRRLTKGPPFPVQPGHWLLFNQGLLVLVILPAWCVFALLQSQGISDRFTLPSVLFVGLQVLTHGTTVGANGWALRRLQAERRWRLLFWIELGFGVCNLLASLTELVWWSPAARVLGFQWMSSFVPAAWVVVASVLDWRRRARRDWLHWTGVVVQLSGTALAVSTNLCLRLVQ